MVEKNYDDMFSRFNTIPLQRVTDRLTDGRTDGRTDRQTDRIAISISIKKVYFTRLLNHYVIVTSFSLTTIVTQTTVM